MQTINLNIKPEMSVKTERNDKQMNSWNDYNHKCKSHSIWKLSGRQKIMCSKHESK